MRVVMGLIFPSLSSLTPGSEGFSSPLLKLQCLSGSCRGHWLLLGFWGGTGSSCARPGGAEVVDCDPVRIFVGIRLALGTTASCLQVPSDTLCVLGSIDGRRVAVAHGGSLHFTRSVRRKLLMNLYSVLFITIEFG